MEKVQKIVSQLRSLTFGLGDQHATLNIIPNLPGNTQIILI